MSSRKALVFFSCVSLSLASAILACVGDEPATADAGASSGSSGTSEGGGGGTDDAATGTDGSSANDATTPGSDSGGDAGPTVLDVRTLPGLRLWLESTQKLTKAAVGLDLVSWEDSSGRTPDGGVPHVAKPIPYTGGGAVNPGVVANGIASRPSVTFEMGPKLGIPNHDDFNPGTGDFVIAVVGAVQSGTGPFWNLTTQSTAPSGTWLGPGKACTFLGALGAPPKCTTPEFTASTQPHVFVMRRKAAQSIFRVDGTSRGTYDFGVDNPNLGVLDFQQPNLVLGGSFVASMSELVLLVGSTTDASLDALESHLKKKYAIP
ncbi:MAG: hypothetical protein JST00_19250 [Deltaproteobacteria bacterium]|nr:hypothetical protein [Deltaproteobacteria bacterium]